MEIRAGGLERADVQALLAAHAQGMLASSPKDSCHFLDLSGLQTPDVSFWTIWEGDTLLGMGALKQLDATHGEIKSMRTAAEHLGKGAGTAMLRHIIDTARARGLTRLSLETGSTPPFEPALRLYERHGFTLCDAFAGSDNDDPFSRFLTITL